MKERIKAAFITVSGGQYYAWSNSIGFNGGEAQFTYSDKIELTLKDLTPDQAIRFAALMRQERASEKNP